MLDKHNSIDQDILNDYAWPVNTGPNFESHPVGEKFPFVSDNGTYYDLFGNVYHFTRTHNHNGKAFVVVGGKNRLEEIGNSRYVGFRLVRRLRAKN